MKWHRWSCSIAIWAVWLLLSKLDVDAFMAPKQPSHGRAPSSECRMFEEQRKQLDNFLKEKKDRLNSAIDEKKDRLNSMVEEMTPEWLKSPRKEERNWEELETAFEAAQAAERGIPKIGTDGVYQIRDEAQFQYVSCVRTYDLFFV